MHISNIYKDHDIVVYDRGFIGFDNGLIELSESDNSLKSKVNAIKLNKSTKKEENDLIYNAAIDKLYTQLIKGERNFKSFNFKRAILIEAIRSFYIHSFNDWCLLQEEFEYFTENHKNFLNDTFNFILNGERKYGLRVWEYILKKENKVLEINSNNKLQVREFFELLNENKEKNFSITNVISKWVSQSNGYEDLLCSLHLIFGKSKV